MSSKNDAQAIFDFEIDSLKYVRDNINDSIDNIVDEIINSKGKVVLTGIGKSGIIAKKISATFASTGTNSVFMHAGEAIHGDLGIVNENDIIIAISNSGSSEEILAILPSLNKIGTTIISMTGKLNSPLAKASKYVLNTGVNGEGCPINLAPMSSTTSALVMGDALAAILMKKRNFKPEDFALFHPGGSLGKQLLTTISDIMHSGAKIPLCDINSEIDEVILIMTKKSLGAVCVMGSSNNSDKSQNNVKVMKGIITEGDLRRSLKDKESFFSKKAKDIMTHKFKFIESNMKTIDAINIMQNKDNQISVLPVFENGELVGLLRLHDIVKVLGS